MRTEDYDPYLNPGHHLPIDIACEDATVRAKLLALDKKYEATAKVTLCMDHANSHSLASAVRRMSCWARPRNGRVQMNRPIARRQLRLTVSTVHPDSTPTHLVLKQTHRLEAWVIAEA